jgi:methyl-accepting chemotaxis protein
MRRSRLQTKILLSVGLIIFVVLGTSTLIHIQNLRRDYLEAIEWRSEALAQSISSEILKRYERYDLASMQVTLEDIQTLLGVASVQCLELYELNKQKNVTHIAVIDESGSIVAHNDRALRNTPLENPVLLDALHRRKLTTALDKTIYHTFIPVFAQQGNYLGTIDIGFPKSAVDVKVKKVLIQSVALFALFLALSFFTGSFLMHLLLTQPVRRLVAVGQQLAEGNLVQTFQMAGRRDEIAILGTAFSNIAHYLQHIAGVASQIATGVLNGEVRARSEQDILGKAVQEMLRYLKYVAGVATKVAEGDLTGTVQVRSTTDAFGQAIQTMTEGLWTLIVQIRASADQIAATGTTIASLAERDISIVEHVQTSAEQMTSTMHEISASVEEVAHSMEILSSSMEETSASVFQMTSSIGHIAANTNTLTEQTHQTIVSLENTVHSLEMVVESTEVSKQLSRDTNQDALKGQAAVEQVINSMETIQQTMTSAVETITRFAQRSHDIDTILDVIREITEQTSLLALNASIIAAQAGVHGRGFAVVADEIRNLASGVGTSTKHIATIVHTLQQDTSHVVQTIHEGATNVNQGMERTQQAREALQKIIASAQQSSSVVTEIADTLRELMATSHNVVTAMEQVNTMTDDITAATNEQKLSTEQIHSASVHITEMASQIQRATTEQLTGVHQLLGTTNYVMKNIDQNIESSRQIARITKELSSQADILLHSVDRFKLRA